MVNICREDPKKMPRRDDPQRDDPQRDDPNRDTPYGAISSRCVSMSLEQHKVTGGVESRV